MSAPRARFSPLPAIVLGTACWLALAVSDRLPAEPPAADGDEAAAETAPTDNPYLADDDLSPDDLVKYLDRMLAKPDSIREREGYVAAILDATDRLLTAPTSETIQAAALLARFEALHFAATRGNQQADEQLMKLADEWQADPREPIARAARFHLLEQRAGTADRLPPDELPALLVEIKTFLADEELGQRHLRLASRTVKVINLLADRQDANKAFEEFGALFAKSSDRKLARYGKEVAKASRPADLAGETLELEGVTFDGLPFDWASYRGKVVLVDFWATWCGPCRAELPNVLAMHKEYHERGFEVVGISLDEERADLEAFFKDNPLPWVTLFDENSKGWNNPNASKYSVRAIPYPVLVDKEGKVISTAARGEELGRLLKELLPAP